MEIFTVKFYAKMALKYLNVLIFKKLDQLNTKLKEKNRSCYHWCKCWEQKSLRKCFLSALACYSYTWVFCFCSRMCGSKKCKMLAQHFKLIRFFSVDGVTMAKNSMFEYFCLFGAFSWRIQMWLNLSFFLACSIYQYQAFPKKREINSVFSSSSSLTEKFRFMLTEDWWFIKHLNS